MMGTIKDINCRTCTFFLLILTAVISNGQPQDTRDVGDSAELLKGLSDTNVKTLTLTSPVTTIQSQQWPADAVLDIDRNIAIISKAQTAMPLLNIEKGFAKLRLEDGVVLDMQGIELLGLYQPSSDFSLPWATLNIFSASPGAIVSMRDVVFNNLVCPPLTTLTMSLQNAARAPNVTGQQMIKPITASQYCIPGSQQCYDNAILIEDFAYRLPLTGDQGGFTHIMKSVTMVCSSIVTQECVSSFSIRSCMADALAMLDPNTGNPLPPLTSGSGTSDRKSNVLSAILGAVFGAAGGALLMGGIAICFCYRKKQLSDMEQISPSQTLLNSNGANSSNQSQASSDNLQLGVLIGCGSFGRVYKGSWRGRDVAVKKILHSPAEAVKIQREISLSMSLSHPHVVQSLDCFAVGTPTTSTATSSTDSSGGVTSSGSAQALNGSGYMFPSYPPSPSNPDGVRRGRDLCLETWLVQELCDMGPLSTALYGGMFKDLTTGKPLLPALLLRARDVASGMEWLHARAICHGDLKSDNVLLKSDASDPYQCVAKLCDFGLSHALAEGRSHVSSRHYGTITHMSPEVLVTGKLKQTCDVYSFGILLWEMVTGARPWAGLTQGEIVHRIVVDNSRLAFPANTLPAVKELATRCWDKEPSKRPTFTDVRLAITHMIQELDPMLALNMEATWKRVDALIEQPVNVDPKLRQLHSGMQRVTDGAEIAGTEISESQYTVVIT